MRFSDLKTKSTIDDWSKIEGLIFKEYALIGQKYGAAQQTPSNVIKLINGYYMIDRLDFELSLYVVLCSLYTNIEFDNKDQEIIFTNEDCDFLVLNKFKDYLRKVTKNDSYETEMVLKTVVTDEVRRLNSSVFDTDGLMKIMQEFKQINPSTLELIGKFQINESLTKIIAETNKNERSS